MMIAHFAFNKRTRDFKFKLRELAGSMGDFVTQAAPCMTYTYNSSLDWLGG